MKYDCKNKQARNNTSNPSRHLMIYSMIVGITFKCSGPYLMVADDDLKRVLLKQ